MHIGMRVLQLVRDANDVLLTFLGVVERANVADEKLARVVVLDCSHLRGVDGKAAARAMNDLHPDLRIVAPHDVRNLRRDGGHAGTRENRRVAQASACPSGY